MLNIDFFFVPFKGQTARETNILFINTLFKAWAKISASNLLTSFKRNLSFSMHTSHKETYGAQNVRMRQLTKQKKISKIKNINI